MPSSETPRILRTLSAKVCACRSSVCLLLRVHCYLCICLLVDARSELRCADLRLAGVCGLLVCALVVAAVAEQSKVRWGEKEKTESEDRFLCIGSGCLMLSNGDMQEAFDQFDTDGNGLICAAELKQVCDKMTEGEEEEVRIARV